MMKSKKQPVLACPIGNIGASAHPMAAFSCFDERVDLLHWAMRAV
jgi:hypothetical protein